MIGRLRRNSCLWRLSRRLSYQASTNSCTSVAAVVKPTDIPCWQATRPQPQGHVGLAGAAVADGDDVLVALNEYLDWPGLGQVCRVERTRRDKGKETVERASVITSQPPERADAARLLEIWLGLWGSENRLHWVGEVVFGEDRSRCEPSHRRNCWRHCGTW